jgi:tetratricopeptide (TPR) repeat protein
MKRPLALFKTIPHETTPAVWARAWSDALFHLGRTAEASEIVEEYLRTYPTDEGGNVTSVKALLLAKAGREQEAEETIRRAVEIGKGFGHFHHTAYNIASAYALMNKPELAIKWLQTAADDGFPCYPLFENDANLNSLRKDERFITFMAQMKRQWERYKTTL